MSYLPTVPSAVHAGTTKSTLWVQIQATKTFITTHDDSVFRMDTNSIFTWSIAQKGLNELKKNFIWEQDI
jgi:hypothetical protein